MPIRLVPLRGADVTQATTFIAEAIEWSPRTYDVLDAPSILQASNSVWLSAIEGKELIGIAGFTGISWSDSCADVCLGIVPKWRSKGLGKVLATQQNEYGFKTLGLNRLQMVALADSPSCHIAKAVGLTLEGTLRACRIKDGKPHDASIYALLRGV